MSRSLGGIALPAGMRLEQSLSSIGRRSAARIDLAGRPWVFVAPDARRLRLYSLPDAGWVDAATARALVALADGADAAALVWQDGSDDIVATCAFDRSQGPAVACEPLFPGSTWYMASICLIVLED